MNQKKKILHLITGLGRGGAEMMLLKLTSEKVRSIHDDQLVVSMSSIDDLLPDFERQNVRVVSLGMRAGRISISGILKFITIIRDTKPDILQGWMYHANILCSIIALILFPKLKTYWSIHFTLGGLMQEKKLTKFLIYLGRFLAFHPKAIHYVSPSSAENHEKLGYPKSKRIVIPIGFDTDTYAPDSALHQEMRRSLALNQDEIIIGHVARYHPMKDHENFLNAAKILLNRDPSLRSKLKFLMIGKDVDGANSVLNQLVHELGLNSSVMMLGQRSDIPNLMKGFDIFCLSSAYGESFPNVLGEAMSCGVPCVATDLGDCRNIIGAAGMIVPPKNPDALASALLAALHSKDQLGKEARSRIIQNFSIQTMVDSFQELYH